MVGGCERGLRVVEFADWIEVALTEGEDATTAGVSSFSK